ncbi:MAG: hypothetical protein E7605_09540 [Ruminococcaceae bacterium]|nr:hypothetical protein [Oscillospiraceae bacterium]
MNQNLNLGSQPDVKENVLLGVLGAFLFALAGGALWFVLYLVGFIAALSGLVGVICAIKGYSLFAKKESVKGIVIAVVMTLLVIVIAWYFCLSYDAYIAHQQWFEEGEIDYTITFLDALLGSHIYLSDPDIGPGYWGDLALGLLFCVVGGGSYVVNKIRNAKAAAAYRAVAAAQAAKAEQDALDQAQQEQPKADENETQE